MNSLSLILITTCIFSSLNAQITFKKSFGGSLPDEGYCVRQTPDGGYVVAGKTKSFATYGFDLLVTRFDAYGNWIWYVAISGYNYDDEANEIELVGNDSYVVVGSMERFGQGSRDIFLTKIDTGGNVLWFKTIGMAGRNEQGFSVEQTSDGGFIVAGRAAIFNRGYDAYLIKTDANGDTLWTNTIGTKYSDFPWGCSVHQTVDGGYLLAGSTFDSIAPNSGTDDVYLIKTDANGDSIWSKTYGGAGSDIGYAMEPTHDGGFIIAGRTISFGINNWLYLIKLDANGDSMWAVADSSGWGQSVQQTNDGGYIISGQVNTTYQVPSSIHLTKTDSTGTLQWVRVFQGIYTVGYSVRQTDDGGYIIAGGTWGTNATDYDVYLIKTDSSGELNRVTISGTVKTKTAIPIPGATITLSGDETQAYVTDSSGGYTFTVWQGGDYTLTPSKNNDVVTSNGITAIDIVLTRLHLLGQPFTSPYNIIAADVDSSNSVKTADILLMRSMILQNINAFPNGRLWSFVPSDHHFIYPLSPFPFPVARTYTGLQQSLANEDIIGIKLGDVNDSWDPNIH